jgi:hypothetical protein
MRHLSVIGCFGVAVGIGAGVGVVLLAFLDEEDAGVVLLDLVDEICVIEPGFVEVEDEADLLLDRVEEEESEHADASRFL